MAKTYNRLELDVNKKFSGMITEVQGDSNSRYLDVSLFSNGVPLDLTGHEVKIFMVKPENGGEIWNDGVITDAKAGRCEFLMTTEALSRMGHLQAQISVWKDNTEILSTQVFEIYVTESLLGDSSVESSNEYGTLVLLFQNLYEAYALMTEMVRNIGFPAEIAAQRDIDTMWKAWEYIIANSSVASVLERIGSAEDSGNTTLFGKLNKPNVIKSVQRGTFSTTTGADVTISLPTAVNPNKCVVNLQGLGWARYSSSLAPAVGVYVKSITSKTLTVGMSITGEEGGKISWEVAEYF